MPTQKETSKTYELVSIIMPAYNCQEFIGRSIETVLCQKYKRWELIIVDDCSTDNTAEVIKSYTKKDNRIIYHKLNKNSGAAIARNTALELATGKYIAFLDSDDIWFPQKLEKQITFMISNKYNFTCTSYTKIDESDEVLNGYRKAYLKSDYNRTLLLCPGNSTVIYNASKLGKVKIPDIKKRNDYVMWLSILKKEKYLYGLDEALSSQRIRIGSISSDKLSLVKYHWIVYREIEKLSLIKSSSLIFYWIFVNLFKLR